MPLRRPRIVVTRKLPDVIETRMMELFNARLNLDDHPMSADEIAKAMAEAQVLVPTVTDMIDKKMIAAAGPDLKLIASFGTGVDHVDLDAAKARGITVTNTPGVLTEDTADMTMALLLAAARRLGEGERLVREGAWTGWSPTSMLGTRVGGKRLGIVGMGRIGSALARRARAFGMSIHYHNRRRLHPDVEAEVEATYWESLDQMLAHMDIVSINCPRTPATYHLLSARRLKLLRPHAFIVNTARGNVIDEAAMVQRLMAREIAGAGLDVYEHEPSITPQLLTLDNVVLSPHIGSATLEGRIAMGEKVIVNIKSFVDGHNPPDRVLSTMF
ncbi:MAG: D-glycerate dehydrogenase [Rhodospirillales bacterium]|nr:D-glycerate dehydrogenase [Rhodospirillales bacterium]